MRIINSVAIIGAIVVAVHSVHGVPANAQPRTTTLEATASRLPSPCPWPKVTDKNSITNDTTLTKDEDGSTACIRTSDGSLQCGDMMAKRQNLIPRHFLRNAGGRSHVKRKEHQQRVYIPGKGTCIIWDRLYYDDNASRCDRELQKGPEKWTKSLIGKCFNVPISPCLQKRGTSLEPANSKYQQENTTHLITRTKTQGERRIKRKQHQLQVYIKGSGHCNILTRPYFDNYIKKCLDELEKNSEKWKQSVINNFFDISKDRCVSKRDALEPPALKYQHEKNDTHLNTRVAKWRTCIQQDKHDSTLYHANIQGLGACSFFRRPDFYEGCHGRFEQYYSELTKGKQTWKQSTIDRYFEFPKNACRNKRAAGTA